MKKRSRLLALKKQKQVTNKTRRRALERAGRDDKKRIAVTTATKEMTKSMTKESECPSYSKTRRNSTKQEVDNDILVEADRTRM